MMLICNPIKRLKPYIDRYVDNDDILAIIKFYMIYESIDGKLIKHKFNLEYNLLYEHLKNNNPDSINNIIDSRIKIEIDGLSGILLNGGSFIANRTFYRI